MVYSNIKTKYRAVMGCEVVMNDNGRGRGICGRGGDVMLERPNNNFSKGSARSDEETALVKPFCVSGIQKATQVTSNEARAKRDTAPALISRNCSQPRSKAYARFYSPARFFVYRVHGEQDQRVVGSDNGSSCICGINDLGRKASMQNPVKATNYCALLHH